MGSARGNSTLLHEKCNFLRKEGNKQTQTNESKAAKLFLTQSSN